MSAPDQATPRAIPLTRTTAEGAAADEHARLKQLAERVRYLRAQRGMTRKQFAASSGVSIPHIARLEAGQGNVSVLLLDRLAGALGVSLESLLMTNVRDAPDLALIVEFLRQQSAESLQTIRFRLLKEFGAAPETRQRRIALVGLRGAGKSSVGAALGRRLGLRFVELDREIEQEAGIALNEVFSLYGQPGYRMLERRCLERLLIEQPAMVLATGGGLVTEPLTYELLMRNCFAVWLHAKPAVHYERVRAQSDTRIASSALHRQAMDSIKSIVDARRDLYAAADLAVETSVRSVDQVVDCILGALTAR
jgi:XRE family aerobic/anaerobic benzoate catabolism transcriptional regulator